MSARNTAGACRTANNADIRVRIFPFAGNFPLRFRCSNIFSSVPFDFTYNPASPGHVFRKFPLFVDRMMLRQADFFAEQRSRPRHTSRPCAPRPYHRSSSRNPQDKSYRISRFWSGFTSKSGSYSRPTRSSPLISVMNYFYQLILKNGSSRDRSPQYKAPSRRRS